MSEQTSPKPLHIVQIAPDIAPGSGVAGVASALEREFIAKGVSVERFTLAEARGPRSRGLEPARDWPAISPLRGQWCGSAPSARRGHGHSSRRGPMRSRSATTT